MQESDDDSGPQHSFGLHCPICGDGSGGVRCDLNVYSAKEIRFIRRHAEAYRAAYLDPGHGASSNERRRLEAELRTLPARHDCTCWPSHCAECKRLDDQRSKGSDAGVEIGRSSMVYAPMPSTTMLDLARAEQVLGKTADEFEVARWMSLNGTSGISPRPSPVKRKTEVETVCLMCSRPGRTLSGRCNVCGGTLVAEAQVD